MANSRKANHLARAALIAAAMKQQKSVRAEHAQSELLKFYSPK
jgi:hypothetical protein